MYAYIAIIQAKLSISKYLADITRLLKYFKQILHVYFPVIKAKLLDNHHDANT